jgi:hypothetical protein
VADDQPQMPERGAEAQKKVALELVFIVIIGLFVLGGFIVALNYDFVSARAPIVVMVPLLILIALQFNKTRRQAEHHLVRHEIAHSLRGENREFNSVARFIGFMALLLVLIYLAGHYVGISLFMFVLMYWISREHPVLALVVAIGVTVLLYFLFEYGFNIELYRGYLFRLLSRHGVFE